MLFLVLFSAVIPNNFKQAEIAQRSQLFVLSEAKLKRKNTFFLMNVLIDVLPKVFSVVDLSNIKLGNISVRNALVMMGNEMQFEEVMADVILKSLVGSLVVIVFPIVSGYWVTLLLIPVAFVGYMFMQNQSIINDFRNWQGEIKKDLPGLIDNMQIALKSGRPLLQTLYGVKTHMTNPRLLSMLDVLILNMQTMKPVVAINLFAEATGLPVMNTFATAVKTAMEHGYDKAENEFNSIKDSIRDLRRTGIGLLVKSKPGELRKLQWMAAAPAIAQIIYCFYDMFNNANFI